MIGHSTERFSGSWTTSFKLFSQLICLPNQCTASTVLQLEAKSFSHGSRRPIHPMERAQLLHVSPICPDSPLPGLAGRRGGISSTDSTGLAKPSLVSSATQESGGPPHTLTTCSEHHHEPRGSESPNSDGRTPSADHLAHLRRYYRTEGLSERLIGILRKSWRNATKSPYSNAWGQWDCWCLDQHIDSISAPISDILEYLCGQFETGKQYHTLNNFRSAISMTHSEVDGK